MDFDWQTQYRRYQRYFVNLGQFYHQKKARVYTGIVASILAAAFFLFFAIKPTLVTISGLIKEIQDKKMVAEKLESKIRALGPAQKQYTLIKADLYLVDQALPFHPQVSLLVKQLEALGRQTGVILETIQFSQVTLKGSTPSKSKTTPTPEKPSAKTASSEEKSGVVFDLVASGNYQNLKSFLYSLSSLRRVILIEAFAFKADSENKEATNEVLNLTVKAGAYFLRNDEKN